MATDHSLNLSVTLQDLASSTLKAIKNRVGSLKKEVDSASSSADRLSNSSNLLKNAMTSLGVTLAGLSVANIFNNAVKSSIDFEQQMSVIKSVTNATAKEMEALTTVAQKMGETKFTATEAAAGLEILSRAGLSAAESISAIPHVLDLAAANSMTMADSADIVTNVIRQMGLSFDETQRVTDAFQKTASTSNSTVEQLGLGFSYVGPLARAMGLSIEQTNAILGQLHNQGIKAERSGTGLRQVLAFLGDESSKASKELHLLGITTKDPIKLFEQLATKGDTAEKALTAFGMVASPAIRALTAAVQDNKNLFVDYVGVLNEANGAGRTAAVIMNDNAKGAIIGLSSAWDALRQKMTEPLLEVITDHAAVLTVKIREFAASTDAIKFGENLAASIDSLIISFSNFASLLNDSKDTIVGLISVMTTLISIKIGIWLATTTAAFITIGTAATAAALKVTGLKGVLLGLPTLISSAVVISVIGMELIEQHINLLKEEDNAKIKLANLDAKTGQESLKWFLKKKEIHQFQVDSANIIESLSKQKLQTSEQILNASKEEVDAYKKQLESALKFYEEAKIGGSEAKQSIEFLNIEILKLAPAYEKIAQEQATLGKGATAATERLINSFTSLKNSGETTTTILNELTSGLQSDVSVKNIQDVIFALISLGDTGELTSQQINEGLAKTLSTLSAETLLNFQKNGTLAFQALGTESKQLKTVLESGLRANLLQLGVDFQQVQEGISSASVATLQNIDNIIVAGIASNEALSTSFRLSVDKMSTGSGLEALKNKLESTFKAGKISADQYHATLNDISEAANKLNISNSILETSFASLGIKSSESLSQVAAQAKLSYESIQEAQAEGKATTEDVANAFTSYATKAIQANHGILSSSLEVEASVLGVANKIKSIGNASDIARIKIEANSTSSAQEIKKIGDAAEKSSSGFGGMTLATARAIDTLKQYSDYAATVFTKNLTKAFSLVNAQSFTEYFSTANRLFQATKKIAQIQTDTLGKYTKQLDSLDGVTAKQLNRMDAAIDKMDLLDDSKLSNIRNEIVSIKNAMESFNNETLGTLKTLQNEYDTLQGNNASIENRDYYHQKIALEETYQQAIKYGNDAAITAAQNSLRLAASIHQQKLKNIATEKAQQEEPTSTTRTYTDKYYQDITIGIDSELLTTKVVQNIKRQAFDWT